MQYITTTELRTKTSQLVETLKNKGRVSLIHRSQVIGEILPAQPKALTKEGIERLKILAKELNLPKLSDREREARYRKYMMEKYGKNLP